MRHRHLDYPEDTLVRELGPAALDDLLDRGDFDDWAPLARAVRRDPHGPLAERVLALCAAHPMYGTSTLWREWILHLRSSTRGARHQHTSPSDFPNTDDADDRRAIERLLRQSPASRLRSLTKAARFFKAARRV